MADYISDAVALDKSADQIYDKLTDLKALEQAIKNIPADKVPEDKRELLEGITVDDETITIPGGPAGSITLAKSVCVRPVTVTYDGVGTPVPVRLTAHIQSTGADKCEVSVEAHIDVPKMLAPMINGPMKKMVAEVASNLKALNC